MVPEWNNRPVGPEDSCSPVRLYHAEEGAVAGMLEEEEDNVDEEGEEEEGTAVTHNHKSFNGA